MKAQLVYKVWYCRWTTWEIFLGAMDQAISLGNCFYCRFCFSVMYFPLIGYCCRSWISIYIILNLVPIWTVPHASYFITKFVDETLQCREKKKNRATLGTTSCTPALGLTFFFYFLFYYQILIVLISRYCNGVYEY